MTEFHIAASSKVCDADLRGARLGARFGRLDPSSQLALLAVEALSIDFEAWPRDRIGICLVARAGSLPTDIDYWNGRDVAGGLSPTLFAYTLPSAALAEIAIRYRLRGPNLCFVGDETLLLAEAGDLITRGEADGCVCVCCDLVTASVAEMIGTVPSAEARAFFLKRTTE